MHRGRPAPDSPASWPALTALAALLASSACGGGGGDGGGDGSGDTDADTDSDADTDGGDDTGADPTVEVGGFAITGEVWDQEGGLAGDLCLGLYDPLPQASGGLPVLQQQVTVATDGSFAFEDVAPGSNLGLLLVADDCYDLGDDLGEDGEALLRGERSPTGTLLDVERWGHLGPEDRLEGVVAWSRRTEDVAILQAELEASRAWFALEDGALYGQVFGADGEPVDDGWMRGPESIQILYLHGPGDWQAWEGTNSAGESRYVIPAAPWGSYNCWSAGVDYGPLIGGPVPGLLLHRDFHPIAP